jgi:hypothetical protein
VIRGKIHICPFGLNVPFGCRRIGGLADKRFSAAEVMTPISYGDTEEERRGIVEGNLDVALMIEEPIVCPFADTIFDEKESVDCKYDENLSDIPAGTTGLSGSPSYPHIMIGQMPKAQYGAGEPQEYMNHYTDDNNTNIYYSIYNIG